MTIKTIPLNRLEKDLQKSLTDCADSGQSLVIELPDHRLLTIRPFDADADDELIDNLLQNNREFQDLVNQSKSSARKPFAPRG